MTGNKFKEKFIKRFGNKFDLSKVEYVNTLTPVIIVCPIHGEFYSAPKNILRKGKETPCPECAKELMKSSLSKGKEKFIEEAKKIYGDKYDYSNVEYVNNYTDVIICCKKHGMFKQTPRLHLKGLGCRLCNKEKKLINTDKFIIDAKQVHGDKYDYSNVVCEGANKKVDIICHEHGHFKQDYEHHVKRGQGCPKCGISKCTKSLYSSTEEFIKKAKNIHGDKYDYSKVEYEHNQKKVCIICPEHGEFWQSPNNHIGASNKCGCPKCKMSKLEEFVYKLFEDNYVKYIHECSKKDLSWVGRQRLDFYIPSKKMVVECQGIQHFLPSDFTGSSDAEKNLKKNINQDIKKFNKCTENGLNVIYVVDDKKSVIDLPIYKYNNVYTKEEFIKFVNDEIKS